MHYRGHHRFVSNTISVPSGSPSFHAAGKIKNRPDRTLLSVKDEYNTIRGATLLHGLAAVPLSGYQYIPGN